MVKKIAALAGAGALLLAVVGPALAFSNVAIIKYNDATAVANTGENLQGNVTSVKKAGVSGSVSTSGNNSMTTGNAKAKAKVGIVANVNVGCGCVDPAVGGLVDGGNLAVVKYNDAEAGANSGANGQGNGTSVKKAGVSGSVSTSGNNSMTTGDAKAKAKVFVVVNSSLSWGI